MAKPAYTTFYNDVLNRMAQEKVDAFMRDIACVKGIDYIERRYGQEPNS